MADDTPYSIQDPLGNDPEGAARSEAARKELLRQQGIKNAYGVASASQNAADALGTASQSELSGIDQSTTAGMAGIRAAGAEGLAAGASSGGNTGNAYAGALQAGENSGAKQAQFGGQQALARGNAEFSNTQAVGDARSAAAAQALEATKYAQTSGSQTQDKQKKIADYTTQMQQILQNNKHWYGDDEAQAKQQIEAMVSTEEDPDVKKYFQDQADNYGASKSGYDF